MPSVQEVEELLRTALEVMARLPHGELEPHEPAIRMATHILDRPGYWRLS